MIIQQTTTIIFEYPQDYLQEQEWCKTKEDRWVHKGTDTLGAVYENQISYSIGQPKTEPMKTTDYCKKCNHKGCETCAADGSNSYCVPSRFEPKDEPQTDCNGCKFVGTYDTEFPCANCARKTKDYYDSPQTERSSE